MNTWRTSRDRRPLLLSLTAGIVTAFLGLGAPTAANAAQPSGSQPPGADGEVGVTSLEAGTSQNGWPANSDPAAINVASFPVPGTSPTRSLTVRAGDVKTILIGVAARFDSTVEPLGSDIGGYNYRPIEGSTVLSNHASGTAIDLNWNEHPQGQSGTFSAAKVAAIRRILGLCGNVVRWGGDYNGTVDEMHFEINVPPGSSSLATCAQAMADTGPSVSASASSVVSWGPNRLDVFGRGANNAMFHKSWSGSGWSSWESLGGQFIGDPVVVSWGSNRLDVVGIGTDNAMYHMSWNGSGWSSWENLGGAFYGKPTAVSWGPNRIDLFGTGTNSAMFHKSWNGSGWSSWESLGGQFTGSPTVVSWAPNRLDVLGLGTNYAMFHMSWDGSGWSSWESLGGTFFSSPVAVSWGPNRLDVFGNGTDQAMFHRAWTGHAWQSSWESLGGQFVKNPAVVSWGSNRIDVVGIGTNYAIFHDAWNGSQWGGWESRGGSFSSDPAIASWGTNRLDLFGIGTNAAMFHNAWTGSWQSTWESLGGTLQ